jgi:hypothetical protein
MQNYRQYEFNIDDQAEIIPGESIAGMKLGIAKDALDLNGFSIEDDGSDIETKLCKENLIVYLTKNDSRVYRICIIDNYRGSYKSLKIGCSLSELFEAGFELLFDFVDNEFEIAGIDGLRFGSHEKNYPMDRIPFLKVDYITVFSKGLNGYSQESYRRLNNL